MKELGILTGVVLFTIGLIVSPLGGGKVHGEKGQGFVHDGTQSQGQASMPRLGR